VEYKKIMFNKTRILFCSRAKIFLNVISARQIPQLYFCLFESANALQTMHMTVNIPRHQPVIVNSSNVTSNLISANDVLDI